jgi:hypothetical protein
MRQWRCRLACEAPKPFAFGPESVTGLVRDNELQMFRGLLI